MDDSTRKPLLSGRGVIRIEQFCLASGTEPKAVGSLVETGRLAGLVTPDGAAYGLFDDSLPSANELENVGLSVREDYAPADLQGHWESSTDDGELDSDALDEGSSEFMSW